jgi:protease IV
MTTLAPWGRRLRSVASASWQALDFTRRLLLNLLLLALLGAGLWGLLRPDAPVPGPRTALVLAPQGPLVEQRSSPALRERALAGGQGQPQVLLREWVAALDAAARDDRIGHAVLLLDDLGNTGLPVLREAAAAVQRFKAAGKPVYAWASLLDQSAYFLAAHASQTWVDPMGAVFVEGYGRHRTYYRELLDKAGIRAHVLRAGSYKNAMETFAARK